MKDTKGKRKTSPFNLCFFARAGLEVFPLYDAGQLYAVLQTGIHHFYLREWGKEDKWSSTAKFAHIWVLKQGVWILSEVISYDHRDPPLESQSQGNLPESTGSPDQMAF